MSIFKLIRAFQKAKGRSPSPNELAQLKKQAEVMQPSNVLPFQYKKRSLEDLLKSGEVTRGTVSKTTKKKPAVDPKFEAAVKAQDERSESFSAFKKRMEAKNKEAAFNIAFKRYKDIDKKPLEIDEVISIYTNLGKYPKGKSIIIDDIYDIRRGYMLPGIGNRSREMIANKLDDIVKYKKQPDPFKKPIKEIEEGEQLEMDFTDWDSKGMKGGGIAHMLGQPRVPMMYGGDPGFAFEYGGSWADWRDNHQHMMPLMEYIGTKLPKERTPFRQGVADGGITRVNMAGGGRILKWLLSLGNKKPKSMFEIEELAKKQNIIKKDEVIIKQEGTDSKTGRDIIEYDVYKKSDKKRPPTEDEVEDYMEELPHGGEMDWYDFGNTVDELDKAVVDHKAYVADMYQRYQRGDLEKYVKPEVREASRLSYQKKIDKVLDKAYDEVFYQKPSSGDYKYDADVLADSIAEQLGKNYEDLAVMHQRQIYDSALKRVTQDMKIKRTLKDVNQKIELQMFDPKDRKPNASGGRIGFDKGGFSKGRRNFLKLAAGLASIPVLGKYFKWAKPAAKTLKAVEASNAAGMPAWFPKLVDRVMKEGTDVGGTVERQVVKQIELPGSKTKVTVDHDLNTGDTIVDIGEGKHGWEDGRHGQPTRLTLTKGQWIEPEISKTGKFKKKKGVKTKDEFDVEEAEFTGDAESVKYEDGSIEKYGDHASDFTEVEKYATGKNVDKKIVGKKREADQLAEGRAEMQAEEMDDFASGGLAHMLGR